MRPALLAPLALLGVACGVPISASEMTATVVVQQEQASLVIATLAPEQSANRTGATGSQAVSSQAVATSTRASSTATPGAATTANGSSTPRPDATGTGTPASLAALGAALTPTGTVSSTTTPSASGTPTPTGTPSKTATPSAAMASDVLSLVNAYRLANGRSALTPNADLQASAESYARYMGQSNFFAHEGLDGSTPGSRVARSGYDGGFRGEALSAGQTSAAAAVSSWQNSPAHNAILLSSEAVDIGIGYAYVAGSYYGHYWVLVTGAP